MLLDIKKMSEIKIQKRLTFLGLTSLASIPVTGPLGFFGAATIFAGKRLRLDWNDKARKNYEAEKKLLKGPLQGSHYNPSIINESPGTAIARQVPVEMARVLERDSRRKNYVAGLREGSKIVGTYLRELPKEEHSKIKQITIYPEQQIRVFGIPFGRKSLETKIIR